MMQYFYKEKLVLIYILGAEVCAQTSTVTPPPEEEEGDPEGFVYPLVGIGLIVSCCVFSALLYRRFFGPCDMGTGGGAAAASAAASNATSQTNPVQQVCSIPGMQPSGTGGAAPSNTPKPSPKERRSSPKRSPKPARPAPPPIIIHPVSPYPAFGMPPMHSLSTPALTPQVPSCPPSPAHEPFEPMHSPGYMGYPSPAWGAPAGYGTPYHYSHQPHSF
ncbi:uncharacterized protein [Penaeus vannamei]|uniref:uncharacterized protein n=1 Tax=Penaeus vannamei TaxID=6689 RepID=UPI00387F6293